MLISRGMSEHERSFIVLRYTSFVGAVLLAGGRRGMVEMFAGDTSANKSLCESSSNSLSFCIFMYLDCLFVFPEPPDFFRLASQFSIYKAF